MIDLNSCTPDDAWRNLAPTHLGPLLERIVAEDGADQDLTTARLIDPARKCRARIVSRRAGVVAGLGLSECWTTLGKGIVVRPALGVRDGAGVEAGATLFELEGPLAALLPRERVALNLLGIAMGTATLTRRFVDECAGTRAKICDTRKTIPGLRWLQKYAVKCGGGWAHRWGLNDAILAKDNHAAGHSAAEYAALVAAASTAQRASGAPLAFIAAEADTMEQCAALLALPEGALSIVLLDGFSLEDLRAAVALRDRLCPGVELEASGGVTLETVGAIAKTGVDRISVGAITHSAPWHDVALDID